MPKQALQVGLRSVITQNISYALPGRLVYVTSSHGLDTSLDETTWTALSGATTGALTSAAFVRCTGGNATVLCKAGTIVLQ